MTDYKELLIEARNLLVLCTMLDKSDHCQSMVNKIDQALLQPPVIKSVCVCDAKGFAGLKRNGRCGWCDKPRD